MKETRDRRQETQEKSRKPETGSQKSEAGTEAVAELVPKTTSSLTLSHTLSQKSS
jgi:hypothetical protein